MRYKGQQYSLLITEKSCGATGGASFATRGSVNGLRRTFRKRPTEKDLIFWGGRQNFGGEVAPFGTPLAPPLHTSYGSAAQTFHKSTEAMNCRWVRWQRGN